jgi:hypothetical protein
MHTHYRYARPVEGQIEEVWFAGLSVPDRQRLVADIAAELIDRRNAWNLGHARERWLPRPDEERKHRPLIPEADLPAAFQRTRCTACGEEHNVSGYCVNKQCSRHGQQNGSGLLR